MKAKFVSENINFERGGSPLGRMGIGGFSYDTLRPGTIIQSKKWFGISGNGKLSGYHGSRHSIKNGTYLLVTEIFTGEKPKSKTFYYILAYSIEKALEMQDDFKKTGKAKSFHGTANWIDSLTKTRFNYRFDIIKSLEGPMIEPIKESHGFHRGLDPKRSMGIGHIVWKTLKPGDILIPKKNFKVDRYGTPTPASRGGGMYFYKESPLVVVRVKEGPVLSSSSPSAKIKPGFIIHTYTCWEMADALEASTEIRSGTFGVVNLRRPIKATEKSLDNRLDIYIGRSNEL